MDKVKSLISLVVVITIIGGALAFKAKKLPLVNVYCSTFMFGASCQKVMFTTDNFVVQSDNPCSEGLFYMQGNCPITTAFTTEFDGIHTIQKVKQFSE